jgi:hypothetical protein
MSDQDTDRRDPVSTQDPPTQVRRSPPEAQPSQTAKPLGSTASDAFPVGTVDPFAHIRAAATAAAQMEQTLTLVSSQKLALAQSLLALRGDPLSMHEPLDSLVTLIRSLGGPDAGPKALAELIAGAEKAAYNLDPGCRAAVAPAPLIKSATTGFDFRATTPLQPPAELKNRGANATACCLNYVAKYDVSDCLVAEEVPVALCTAKVVEREAKLMQYCIANPAIAKYTAGTMAEYGHLSRQLKVGTEGVGSTEDRLNAMIRGTAERLLDITSHVEVFATSAAACATAVENASSLRAFSHIGDNNGMQNKVHTARKTAIANFFLPAGDTAKAAHPCLGVPEPCLPQFFFDLTLARMPMTVPH